MMIRSLALSAVIACAPALSCDNPPEPPPVTVAPCGDNDSDNCESPVTPDPCDDNGCPPPVTVAPCGDNDGDNC